MTDNTIKTQINKKQKSKMFKMISNILFTLFMIIMALLIFITAQSRLTGQEPSLFGYRIYIVDSGSMAPTLPVDSMIIVKEIKAEQIQTRDIVTYYAGNEKIRVTHRVVEVVEGGKQFITRGDANNTEDPNILEGDRIIGKVIFKIPYIGTVFRGLSSAVGIALLITLGVIWIILPKAVKTFKQKGTI